MEGSLEEGPWLCGRGSEQTRPVVALWRVLSLKAGGDRSILKGRLEKKMEEFEIGY